MFTSEIYPKWMREKQLQKYEDLKGSLPDARGLVLDMGCGPGWLKDFLTKNYPGIKYIGIDIQYEPDVLSSGDYLPFKANTFDFVFCIDTIHLLKYPGEMERVLKKDGMLVIAEAKSLWKENVLNKFKNLKIVKKSIIGREEQDILVILQK